MCIRDRLRGSVLARMLCLCYALCGVAYGASAMRCAGGAGSDGEGGGEAFDFVAPEVVPDPRTTDPVLLLPPSPYKSLYHILEAYGGAG
eukprot:171671-Rhodomonas_salina.1